MFDCKMIINKMNIEKNKLNLSVSISCPFDIDVTSPKAKIIFNLYLIALNTITSFYYVQLIYQ